MNWTKVLGELGLESPGYRSTLEDCRKNPWLKPGEKTKPAKKTGKKARFTSVKHGSD